MKSRDSTFPLKCEKITPGMSPWKDPSENSPLLSSTRNHFRSSIGIQQDDREIMT